MPKATPSSLPLSALFAVAKPSGPTSMAIINDIKALVASSRLFMDEDKLQAARKQKGKGNAKGKGKRRGFDVKMGQGGTLDPLADGVLVVGVNKGTKKLGEFLDCVKEYRTTCLLGCETDSYDSEGARVRIAPWRHVTREKVESALDAFRGKIQQAPPIFSALKMDGMPLYEYARKGIPLPRPIETREVTVHALELTDWLGSDHAFRWPEKTFSEEEKRGLEKALEGVGEKTEIKDDVEDDEDGVKDGEGQGPTAFVLSMRVTGGTYVRSLVHDLGHALDSVAHVVTLTRSRQGQFVLEPVSTEEGETEKGCVPWDVFERAMAVGEAEEVDVDGWSDWERAVLDKLEIVDDKNK